MQTVPGEVGHCLWGNFRDNLEEEGVSPQIPTAVEEGNHHEEERQDV
jgi:hypothetical protein